MTNIPLCRIVGRSSGTAPFRRRSRMGRPRSGGPQSRGFTLIELTIVIAIIGILALLALSAANAAYQQSRVQRTQAIVAKIDQLIMEKYDSYRTRPVPIRVLPNTNPRLAATIRLAAMRELMRLEMPDRITDVTAGPGYTIDPMNPIIPSGPYTAQPLAVLTNRGSLNKNYLRRADRDARDASGNVGIEYWSDPNENAECLYLILAAMRDGDKSALDFFSPSEIGDVDGDGMKEILDSWGQPIVFLRWAPGYCADVAPFPVTQQVTTEPDPYDPMKVDPRWTNGPFTPFALKPLIWSAGPDKKHDINVGGPNVYTPPPPPNPPPPPDPYAGGAVIGSPADSNADGYLDYADNITNHDQAAR